MMDLPGINSESAHSARDVHRISNLIEDQRNYELLEKRKKERRELDNHDNLDSIANSSKESVEYLKEMLEVQKRNCDLLEEKNLTLEESLESIKEILRALFSTTAENGAIQEDLLKQSNALACEISYSLDQGQKIDFKDKFADVGIQGLITAIGICLRMKGILP